MVKLVTSLAASNIKHPIIALFDNDTAGIMEMNKLAKVKLPHNFRVLKYPDISIAKKYPTIGPTGIKKMNINGLACAIEIYFGETVLQKEGKLIPIRWKSFEEKEKKYQGEISQKNYIQDKFRKELIGNDQNNFAEMKQLLSELFRAFQTT